MNNVELQAVKKFIEKGPRNNARAAVWEDSSKDFTGTVSCL